MGFQDNVGTLSKIDANNSTCVKAFFSKIQDFIKNKASPPFLFNPYLRNSIFHDSNKRR